MNLVKIQNILWEIAKRHSLIFFILLIFAMTWGGFLFYKDFVLVKKVGPELAIPKSLLDQKAYQEVVKVLEAREENLKNIELKSYLNPFQEATSTAEEGVEESVQG